MYCVFHYVFDYMEASSSSSLRNRKFCNIINYKVCFQSYLPEAHKERREGRKEGARFKTYTHAECVTKNKSRTVQMYM